MIEFQVPLPPRALRVNHRTRSINWAAALRVEYSNQVAAGYLALYPFGMLAPWPAAKVHLEWRQCEPVSDHDNAMAACKTLIDTLCVAPRRAGKNRWYLGIVADDKHIKPSLDVVRVANRAEEGIIVRLEKSGEVRT